MKKENAYVSPTIELVEFEVEVGFATSGVEVIRPTISNVGATIKDFDSENSY